MTKKLIIPFLVILVLFTLALPTLASEDMNNTPDIEWQKCLGGSGVDRAESIIQTADGGYAVAGNTDSTDGNVSGNHGSFDCWVVKLGSTSEMEWQKCLGGSGVDRAESIIQTADGGYAVAGDTDSNDGDVSGNHGIYDFWVVKLSSTCEIEWQKCLGGSERDYAGSIIQTTDGGYAVAGITDSNDGDVSGNHASYDYWVVKLNSTGEMEWQKCLGGNRTDWAHSIIQTADGGYAVAGETYSNNTGDVSGFHGHVDYWVVKLNSTGEMEWQKCLGGSDVDYAHSIIQTADGGYAVAGTTRSDNTGDVSGYHGDNDFWVVRLDSIGEMEWQKCLGGSDWESAESIIQTTDGGYTITGWTDSNDGNVSGNHGPSDFWAVRLDSTGEMEWQKCLGGSERDLAKSIIQTTDDGYVLAGITHSNDGDVSGNHGSDDYWVIRLKSPTALFSAIPTDGPAPLTVNFTDHSTGNPTNWSWLFGDGNVSTQQNPATQQQVCIQ